MSALNVLIPLDGSSFSRRILDGVHSLLTPKRHHLFLMRVVHAPAGVGTIPLRTIPVDGGNEILPNYTSSQDLELSRHPIFDTQTWENLKAEVSQDMSQDVEDLRAAGFDVTVVLHTGEAVTEIVQAVATYKIDLVVMASHGRKGLERLIIGSVAEQVFQHIEVPVLMLRPDQEHPSANVSREKSHILVPLDRTEFSRTVLQHIDYLLDSKTHEITLLHVAPVPELDFSESNVIPGTWSVTTDYPKSSHEDRVRLDHERSAIYVRITEEFKEQLYKEMQDTRDKLQEAGFKVNLSVRFGDPAEEIKLFAQYEHIDLVVMATHCRVGLDRLMLGSVARDVLRGTHVPVLMIRPNLEITVIPTISEVLKSIS